ncbi:hypothetical protein BX600DRAFT_224562 [Xylariales sp. PMI_506]|nr:hypothetical protein BX600DRAFT_224562 [Xylariales sp. PMI_506]
MAISSAIPAALGLATVLATATVLILDVMNAHMVQGNQTIRTTAIVAAVCEGIVLTMLLSLFSMSFRHSIYYGTKKLGAAWLPVSLITVVLATTASVVYLALLARETASISTSFAPERSYFAGTAVALGCAFVGQLIFSIVYFVGSRMARMEQAQSLHTEDSGSFTPQMRQLKAIPYSQTSAGINESKEQHMSDFRRPPGSSSSNRSATETMSSIRSSLSHRIAPKGSRTRLLSTRSANSSRTAKQRPSVDSFHSYASEGFDSWDTSAVESGNTLPALDTSLASPQRFLGALETIPASPTVSRSPSPGCPLDLEPPRRNRSRSYSPVPRPPPSLTSHPSTSELHIHPLFRADSPVPPPAATPGTSIIAAPDAARTVSLRTVRSMSRVRSGSLPASASPLSHHNSFEDFHKGKTPSPTGSALLSPTLVESELERQMTPPLPDWIMNAGSRTSLTEYELRKQRDRESSEDSG